MIIASFIQTPKIHLVFKHKFIDVYQFICLFHFINDLCNLDLFKFFQQTADPSAPLDVFCDIVLVDSVLVHWSPPQHPNGVLIGFEVRLVADVRGIYKTQSYNLTSDLIKYKYTGLDAFTQYQIQASNL